MYYAYQVFEAFGGLKNVGCYDCFVGSFILFVPFDYYIFFLI